MLVTISDIHFVDGTAGEHNLPFSAFESVFLSDILSLAEEKEAKEIIILLLGDVVDLIRSTKWLDLDRKSRPWGAEGLRDIPSPREGSGTEQQCLKIMGQVPPDSLNRSTPPQSLDKDTILFKNWETFKLFRDLGTYIRNHTQRDIPSRVIYVPGNHDRLCNLYPAVRDELRKTLGLTVSPETIEGDPDGQWWFRSDFEEEAYGVYARHGHQYDVWNFGGGNDLTRLGHLQVPVGDVLTTEFAVKIPWLLDSLRKKYRISKAVVEKTKDIDNVRPLSGVLEWIYYRMRQDDHGRVRKALDEVFDRSIKELLKTDLIQQWRSPRTHVDELVRLAGSRWLRWIPGKLLDLLDGEDLLPLFMGMTGEPADPEKDLLLQAAYRENIWRENRSIRFVVYGHTHTPLQRPLDAKENREIFYINTGTWRNGIHKTVGLDQSPDFVDLKQMTYTIFYREDEDERGKEPNTLSFDTWTGTKKKYYRNAPSV